MRNAVLVQQAYKYMPDDFRPMLELARPRHQAYADKWDMDYLVVHGYVKPEWTDITMGGWAKIELVRTMLEIGYEYVFWVDADALIANIDIDLRGGCPDGLGMVEHSGPAVPGPHLNVGVMFFHNTDKVRAFVTEWMTHYPGLTVFPWREQGQANIMSQDPKWAGVVTKIDPKWNSCIAGNSQVDRPVIEAWHGMGNAKQRYEQMRAYLAVLEKGVSDG
jgi:hypothetical protein